VSDSQKIAHSVVV